MTSATAQLNRSVNDLLDGLRRTGSAAVADAIARGIGQRDPLVQADLYAVCSDPEHPFRVRADAFGVHEVIITGTWPTTGR